MGNTISQIEEGILLSTFTGDIDLDSVNEFVNNVKPYLNGATPIIHFVVDAKNEGRWSVQARQQFTEIFDNQQPYGKVGIINAGRITRVVATFLMIATDRRDLVRFFNTQSDAIAWLKE